jgi:hypothetical protein
MKKLLLVLASASFLSISGCGNKGDDPTPTPTPTPSPTPTLVGTWNVISTQNTNTPTTGAAVTTTQTFPTGQRSIAFTSTTFQGYVNGVAQDAPGTYSITGTTYTFKNSIPNGIITRTAQIVEFTPTRFVTVETFNNGSGTTMLTNVLTR